MSISTPLALAPDYCASRHATIRYYVLHHPDPVAVVIAGKYVSGGSVPVWSSVESPAFLARFGTLKERINGRLLIAGGEGKPVGDIARRAMSASEIATKELALTDLRGDREDFVAEAFFNQHNLFVMVTAKRAARFGRRVQSWPAERLSVTARLTTARPTGQQILRLADASGRGSRNSAANSSRTGRALGRCRWWRV